MNTLNMYSREQANKIHLDEMYREAQSRRLLRLTSQEVASENAATRRDYTSLFVLRFTRWFWSRLSQNIDNA